MNSRFNLFLRDHLPAIIINTAISLAISSPLLMKGIELGGDSVLYDLIPFAAHYFMLNLILGLLIFTAALLIPFRAVLTGFAVALYILLQVMLVLDTRVYTIYHFHLNSMVWNLIVTEGITDSVVIGKGTVATFVAITVLIAAMMGGMLFITRRAIARFDETNLNKYYRASKSILIAGICLIIADKALYAYGDMVNNTAIMKSARLYPLYQPLTVKRFAVRKFGYKPSEDLALSGTTSGAPILYPKSKLEFDPSQDKRYNILLITVEGLRFDMLTDDNMPNLSRFARENIRFVNHYSGGNDSRFGVFSLIYGLQGSYWHTFLAHRTPPVLIDALIGRGYDFSILSSTSLKFPEFRSTAFAHVLDKVEDTLPNTTSDVKDRIITNTIISYINKGKLREPFFGFMFFNSTHESYDYPKEFKRYSPVLEGEINYFSDIDKEKAAMLLNRFRNAAFYEDYLIGLILDTLSQKGMLDRTIVMVTGDHGEEFYERGFLGHTSAFDDFQTRTVAVLHYPGQPPATVERMTSHMDLVPLLMDSIGSTGPRGNYTQGISLLSDEPRAFIPVAGWDKLSLIDAEHVITFSTETYNIGVFEVRRRSDYAEVDNPKDILKSKRDMILSGSRGMSEFFK